MKTKVIFLLIMVTVLLSLTGCPWQNPLNPTKFTLTINVEGLGQVSPASGSKFDPNTTVTLTPTPTNNQWIFDKWAGPNGADVINNQIVMNTDKTITAVFKEINQNQPMNLHGVVLDLETMLGIVGAKVEIYENNVFVKQITSTTAGYFETTLPQGTYTCIASAAGYVNNTANNVKVVDIVSDTQIVNVSFALPPVGENISYCSITGKVSDNSGNALPDVLITVDGGVQTNGVFVSKNTDANGNYFVYGIPLTDTNGNPLSSVKVTAFKNGYLPKSQNIPLIANQTIPNVDFSLATGTISENIYYEDDFESAQSWTPSGFWHLQANAAIVNKAVPKYVILPPDDLSNGYIPYAYSGNKCYWYGLESTGNFIGTQITNDPDLSGGTSTEANSGDLYSPVIDLTNALNPTLSFMTWYEIESVNPNEYGYDIMTISIYNNDGTTDEVLRLNPFADPITANREHLAYTSGGFNQAGHWIPVTLDLSTYAGAQIQLIFTFETNDELYNGFRGWFIDDVKVAEQSNAAIAGETLVPQTYSGVRVNR